jgi:hypothetical protein
MILFIFISINRPNNCDSIWFEFVFSYKKSRRNSSGARRMISEPSLFFSFWLNIIFPFFQSSLWFLVLSVLDIFYDQGSLPCNTNIMTLIFTIASIFIVYNYNGACSVPCRVAGALFPPRGRDTCRLGTRWIMPNCTKETDCITGRRVKSEEYLYCGG